MQMTRRLSEIKYLRFHVADSNPTGNPKSGGTHSSWSGGKTNNIPSLLNHTIKSLQNVRNKFELIYFVKEAHRIQFKAKPFQDFVVKSPKDKIRSTCYDFSDFIAQTSFFLDVSWFKFT